MRLFHWLKWVLAGRPVWKSAAPYPSAEWFRLALKPGAAHHCLHCGLPLGFAEWRAGACLDCQARPITPGERAHRLAREAKAEAQEVTR